MTQVISLLLFCKKYQQTWENSHAAVLSDSYGKVNTNFFKLTLFMCLWGDIFLNIPVKSPSPLWTQSSVQNGDILLSETWV